MQERIRYYITKSGEEPTVRSVKVAKGSPQREDLDVSIPAEVAEPRSAQDAKRRPAEVRAVAGKARRWRSAKRVARGGQP